MTTVEDAKIELSKMTQRYILGNNMEFGREEYKEVIIAICTICHFIIIRKYKSPTTGMWLHNMSKVWVETESMITIFLIAAEKLMPVLCSSQIDQIIMDRVFDWAEEENIDMLLKTSDLVFDFNVSLRFPDFLLDM